MSLRKNMLHLTQILTLEIGQDCNLEHVHDKCPIGLMDRSGKELTDEKIVGLATEAYSSLGFEGFVCWSMYNEPMLHHGRMFGLMEEIRESVPESRFLLWTNGTILIEDPRMGMFERIYVSNYLGKPYERLLKYFGPKVLWKDCPELDGRLSYRGPENRKRCTLPFDNFLVSNTGNVHICCVDWKNEVKVGNIFESTLEELDGKRWELTEEIIGKEMTDGAPDTCLHCGSWHMCEFDREIMERAERTIQEVLCLTANGSGLSN